MGSRHRRLLFFLAAALVFGQVADCAKDFQLPKLIWSYWEGADTDLVDRCTATWRRWAPGWSIQVLNFSSARQLLGEAFPERLKDELRLWHLTDVLRLELLAAYGGVWLDATLALTVPLESWAFSTDGSLVGFELDYAGLRSREVSPLSSDWASHFHANGTMHMRPWEGGNMSAVYFENWSIVAPLPCHAVLLWRDEMRQVVSGPNSVQLYMDKLLTAPESEKFLHPDLRRWLPYQVAFAALAKVRFHHPAEVLVTAMRAETQAFLHLDYAIDWPLAYIQQTSNYAMDGTGGAFLAFGRSPWESPPPPAYGPVIKIRGIDRGGIRCSIDYRAYASDSPLASLLSLPAPPFFWHVRAARYAAGFEARFHGTTDPFLIVLFVVLRKLLWVLLLSAEHPVAVAFMFGILLFRFARKFSNKFKSS